MKGDICTRRLRRKDPRGRWEATRELCPGGWIVAYGFTRRRALRALRAVA